MGLNPKWMMFHPFTGNPFWIDFKISLVSFTADFDFKATNGFRFTLYKKMSMICRCFSHRGSRQSHSRHERQVDRDWLGTCWGMMLVGAGGAGGAGDLFVSCCAWCEVR